MMNGIRLSTICINALLANVDATNLRNDTPAFIAHRFSRIVFRWSLLPILIHSCQFVKLLVLVFPIRVNKKATGYSPMAVSIINSINQFLCFCCGKCTGFNRIIRNTCSTRIITKVKSNSYHLRAKFALSLSLWWLFWNSSPISNTPHGVVFLLWSSIL